MNLYFRLIWTLLRAWRLPQISIDEPFERVFRVLPNDIDINLHMNNGRYLTISDLLSIEFFARSGFLKVLLKNRWRPITGGSIITYRRQLKFNQKYRVRYQWAGSDDHWNYLSFQFLTLDGKLCASGYSKGAGISRKGLVRNGDAFAAFGFDRHRMALPEAVVHWIESEKQIVA